MPTLQEDIDYIRIQLRQWHTQLDLPSPGVPIEMRVDPKCKDEWQYWKMIDSTYQLTEVEALESKLPAPLPQFFKAFMLSCHTLGMDFGEYGLPESRPGHSLERNFSALLSTTHWKAGYMLFGDARGCGDPLLFDFLSPTADGTDYAVVLFNHDVVPVEFNEDREQLRPYESKLAPSFREFFDLLLNGDDSIFPAPKSPEEERRDAAWAEVAELLEQRGLPRFHRPPGISPSDP